MMSGEKTVLDGAWVPRWSTWEDQPTSDDDLKDVTLTFTDGRVIVTRGDTLIRFGHYMVDVMQSPMTLDVTFTESDVPELIGQQMKGIFERDGDTLRVCYGPAGGDRADSFATEPGTGKYMGEYERVGDPSG